MFRQNEFRNLADYRESRAQPISDLSLVKRLEQLGLLDANEFAGFLLHIPDWHVGKNLNHRAAADLQSPGPGGDTTNTPRAEPEKTHQAVRLDHCESVKKAE